MAEEPYVEKLHVWFCEGQQTIPSRYKYLERRVESVYSMRLKKMNKIQNQTQNNLSIHLEKNIKLYSKNSITIVFEVDNNINTNIDIFNDIYELLQKINNKAEFKIIILEIEIYINDFKIIKEFINAIESIDQRCIFVKYLKIKRNKKLEYNYNYNYDNLKEFYNNFKYITLDLAYDEIKDNYKDIINNILCEKVKLDIYFSADNLINNYNDYLLIKNNFTVNTYIASNMPYEIEDEFLNSIENNNTSTSLEKIKKFSLICDSAYPYKFIISSIGKIRKCKHYENANTIIGEIKNGDMIIDYNKYAMWIINDLENNEKCTNCILFFSCAGSFCPRIRIEKKELRCPRIINNITI